MTPRWQEFLGANGARIDSDSGLVTDFGDLAAELGAARNATVVSPLTHLGLLEFSGDEAKTYLQNQLTSDVNHLGADQAQHSSWCSAKGRMLASFVVYRDGTDYRTLLSADLLDAIQKRLQIYVLRSKVKIARRSDDFEFVGLSGPEAERALQNAGLPVPSVAMATAAANGATVIRLDDKRFILAIPVDTVSDVWKQLTAIARPAGTTVWQWLDIQAGIPLISEPTKEAFVPQMVNFDTIGGVSFKKGCYPGQEVIARTHYLGKVKRHLYRFHADGPVAAGNVLHAPGAPDQACGMVANAAPAPDGGYDGLAVVLENDAGAVPAVEITGNQRVLSHFVPVVVE
ncbi:YgfZ/GcvT domain-containing protein [Propionivibrio limicola]|uniref:CAF17-like 4Fe-4S cluster assembly/insertion protein YgfZ n=1 Tax=Propionivibrio limicola TaxID=167645 RepID=UPI0012918893|nr:folate-binding protein YgfZ [Propionivibrio limicola]